ncbi:FAD/NAD(P)-binding domain-containing protein [Plenodomus tracheiphilus IPT5]|uniref:FAD/NAD(P)-binding domain-containing protein n=1 Tax=Plenodomus tracheiphilus IPT5 TaxID=1408161 RepID=A0A6A7BPG2_9PLEO|nr:FAD/NAD(P)-binding domain-containing protein [Plenodomus tracheiphilus IPT5]
MAQAVDVAPSRPFKILIIGAGFVGLSLSHALQLADIDHIVLEKHDQVVSVRGAALIIWPGVARIFDQFGFLDKILKTITPVRKEYTRWPDGSVQQVGTSLQDMSKLFQTEAILTDRETCVTHLYENLPDKSKVHTGRRLDRIEHTPTGVRVHLTDGSVEEGDIVIGADGVHSDVRSQMWDFASKHDPKAVPESDRSALFSDYGALFCTCVQQDSFGLSPVETNIILGHDATKLMFTQKGKTYWAVIFRDGHSQPPKKRPISEESAKILAQRFADLQFTETLKFRDLWENRLNYGLLNIEEGILEKWHAGRIVLVGDSACKMTSELGFGANIAIESAITLANILHRELKANPNRHFTHPNSRPSSGYVELSGQVTRMYSYQTLFSRLLVGYVSPWIQHSQFMKLAESISRAPKLDYVPVRTMNEDAEGWKLAKKGAINARGGWRMHVLLTSTVGVAIAYAVSAGFLGRT